MADSDPEIEFVEKDFVEKDSGMESLTGSKDETPERKNDKNQLELTNSAFENYDDEPDESLAERIWGLTEMFPAPIRNFTGAVTDFTCKSVTNLYKFSCNASWIFFTSSMILFAPVIFETERAQMEEMQRSQQKQVLLGPGSAGLTPGGTPGSPNLPPMPR